MDPAAIAGILIAFGAIFGAQVMEGGSPASLMLIPPLMLVWVGSMGAALASNTLINTIGGFKWLIYAMTAKKPDIEGVVDPLVKMAERARREGLLALEQEMEKVTDPFMQKGLQMAVDGTDPDDLWEILSAEIKARRTSGNNGAKFFEDAGGYSPTIGIIGTVMGLVVVLNNLAEPETLGHAIASAFIATLWGVLSANVVYLPLGKRIKAVAQSEAARMEIIIEGVLAIQAGANPRVVATKLRSKMTPNGPPSAKEAA
ncbi:MAG: chemotaxis protein MotA [Actinomycetota bacterium]|nr:chemotaxis protein MotA [Actinomycetota bacterium]